MRQSVFDQKDVLVIGFMRFACQIGIETISHTKHVNPITSRYYNLV